jgi:hypothetical protein
MHFYIAFGFFLGILLVLTRLQCPHCALFQTNNLLKTKLEIKIKQFLEVPLLFEAVEINEAVDNGVDGKAGS